MVDPELIVCPRFVAAGAETAAGAGTAAGAEAAAGAEMAAGAGTAGNGVVAGAGLVQRLALVDLAFDGLVVASGVLSTSGKRRKIVLLLCGLRDRTRLRLGLELLCERLLCLLCPLAGETLYVRYHFRRRRGRL